MLQRRSRPAKVVERRSLGLYNDPTGVVCGSGTSSDNPGGVGGLDESIRLTEWVASEVTGVRLE